MIPESPNPLVPKNPPASRPNIRAKPRKKKEMEPTPKSMTFFMMMLPAFLARVNPVSTMANPACMNMTRKAARSVHRMLALAWERGSDSARAAVGRTAHTRAPASHIDLKNVPKDDLLYDHDIKKPPLLKVDCKRMGIKAINARFIK